MPCMQSISFYQFCQSICPPNAGTVSKLIDISWYFFDDLAVVKVVLSRGLT